MHSQRQCASADAAVGPGTPEKSEVAVVPPSAVEVQSRWRQQEGERGNQGGTEEQSRMGQGTETCSQGSEYGLQAMCCGPLLFADSEPRGALWCFPAILGVWRSDAAPDSRGALGHDTELKEKWVMAPLSPAAADRAPVGPCHVLHEGPVALRTPVA